MIPLNDSATIFKFDNVGDEIEGVIVSIEEQPVPESWVDGKPVGQKLSRKGKPLTQWCVTLDTDDGLFRFYTKWRLQKAITDEARRAGAKAIQEGDVLGAKRLADEKGDGAFAAHTFKAWYVPKSDDKVLEDAASAFSDEAPF